MNLFEILKQFKSIEPDERFAQQSRRAIMATPRMAPVGFRRGILRFIETGVAVVLAGFFIVLITGGFTNAPSTAPIQYSVLDTQGLRAEAQAVDMQIQLANVNYEEVAAASSSSASAPMAFAAVVPVEGSTTETSTPSSAPVTLMAPAPSEASSTESSVAATSSATSTASSSVSIDQALEKLSQ